MPGRGKWIGVCRCIRKERRFWEGDALFILIYLNDTIISVKMKLITALLSSFNHENPNFKPTEIYNENWLLKLILHQIAVYGKKPFPLAFNPGSIWFSEAQLPTAFKARYRGDPLAEARTNADGVIGHITIGKFGKTDLELKPDSSQFTVVEAKIASQLSSGIRNARYFNQAARNIACMAEVFRQANINPSTLERVEFILLAPQSAIEKGVFLAQMKLENIYSVVKQRVFEYDGQLDHWYSEWFESTANEIQISTISWEHVIEYLQEFNSQSGHALSEFYQSCLRFN